MVSSNEEVDNQPRVVSDGAGGAIIAWQCDLPHPDPHGVFANRVTGQGSLLWGNDGTRVDGLKWNSNTPVDMADDGAGGAEVCWAGNNGDEYPTIRARRVRFSSGLTWTGGGV